MRFAQPAVVYVVMFFLEDKNHNSREVQVALVVISFALHYCVRREINIKIGRDVN